MLQECGAAGATSGKRVMTAWMSELDRGQGKHNKISVMYSEPLKLESATHHHLQGQGNSKPVP